MSEQHAPVTDRSGTWGRVVLYVGLYVILMPLLLWPVTLLLNTTLGELVGRLWIALLFGLGAVVTGALRDSRR